MRKEKGSDISEESVLALQERIKELDCLYKIYKSLHKATNSDEAVRLVLDQLAGGFRYPDLVTVRIVIDGRQCSSKDTWHESRTIFSDLIVDGRTVGEIGVSLSDQVKFPGEPFLDEERNLLCAVAVGLSNSLEKISTSQIFRENLERFSFAVEASGEGIWDWNIETGEAFFSKRWKDMLGFSDEEISDHVSEWEKRIHPEDVEEVKSVLNRCFKGDIPFYEKEYRLIGKNGSLVWVRDRARIVSRDSEGKPLRMVGMYTDLTQRRMDEIKLQKLNKLLTLMFRANEFLVHAKDEHSLLKGLCDIVVENGGFPLVWIAFKKSGGKMLTPVAVSGVAKGYPYEVTVAWDNSELSRSAIGKAIKTGRTFISREIDSSPDYLPWKKTVLKYGLKSSIAVPLVIGKEIIGGFVIYSTEEDAFDNEEVRLLEELGEDISYGILSLRLEAQLEHQSGVLSSIRRVNQLIVSATDVEELIKRATELMTGSRGFERCLLVLVENENVKNWAASGFSRTQLLEVDSIFESGEIPPLLRRAMEEEGVISLTGREYNKQCVTSSDLDDLAVFAKGLRIGGNILGAMAVVMKQSFSFSKDERDLFSEIVDDISFAIHKIRIEKNERVLQKRFSLFMDKLPGAVFISDSDLKTSYFNDFAARVFGFKEDWKGKNPEANYPGELGKLILEDDRRTQNGENIVREERVLGTDGKERILYVQKFPIVSEEDKPMVGAIAMDITEWKLAEMALTRLGRVIDLSVNELYIFDPETLRFLQANKGAIENSGYSLEELRKMTPLDLKLEMDRRVFEDIISRLKKEPGSYEVFETVHIRKNGTGYPVEVRLQLHDNEYERVFVAIVLDISERKIAEASVKKSLESLINTLSSLVEARDPYTSGHQKRVSELSTAIARKLFSEDEMHEDIVESIRVAALLHDIGKSAVPTEILTKPVRLNNLEYDLVREHSKKGYDILKEVYFPWPIADIVAQHHERLDGSGYPRGLTGDEIRIEARIIAVADVVEAMSSHRPYRASLGIEAALDEIRQNSGKFYDRRVVEACLELFKEGFQFTE
ncbi:MULTISPECIES: PAS domain S-box protein [unclassified Mesotoga]|uniref:PAS domain S-box protein n=2 Tax=Mesotoga TaxID=1184396 RepID=UPI000EF20324|nr:HD domain-containing phosphohydrolase [Mesotoga sp. BH458_6_3_2_1]RLL84257.1 PAS/PAC sensor protein [Mesotoga sp. BH458_6_3_2_1]